MPATESRRRRGQTPELNRDERAAVGTILGGVKKKRPRKLQKWERHELSDFSLLMLCLGVAIVVFTVRYRSKMALNYPSLSGVSKEFRRAYQDSRTLVSVNKNLYDEIYKLATERLKPPDETSWPEYERHPYKLSSEYGPSVQHCPVTVVILEPKLGKPIYDYGPGQPLWFELESVSAFASDACVVLQTTTCAMKSYLGNEATDEEVKQEVINVIYESSLPLFRRHIESGRVRISFLDHQKYNLQSCHEFENTAVAFMNMVYWQDEFLDVDSDMVLVFEEGSSLCYPLTDLDEYRNKALVGSLWPKDATPLVPDPLEGACKGMPSRWKNWLRPQRRWEMQQENPDLAAKQHHPAAKPRELLSEEYPAICENGWGPVAHGGLSLRSRTWMIQAIATCPHTIHSGLKVEEEPFACKVFEAVGDDFYFGTVLAGIGAPLPIAFEASLFAAQMLWPEQVWETYGVPTSGSEVRSSWKSKRPSIQVEGEEITIPNALFRPWISQPIGLLRSEVMRNACPYLAYTFTPDVTKPKMKEIGAEHWTGIGH